MNRLQTIETSIDTGLLAAAAGLHEIWKDHLYRDDYDTFEDYAKKKWGIAKTTAYRLMGRVDTSIGQYKNPKKDDKSRPTSFHQRNESPPINKVIDVEFEKDPPKKSVVHLDQTKRQIPDALAHVFRAVDDRIAPIESLLKEVVLLTNAILRDGTFPQNAKAQKATESNFGQDISNIRGIFAFNRPHAWCPVCGGDGGVVLKGRKKENCDTCKGKGWVNKLGWKAVPEDQK